MKKYLGIDLGKAKVGVAISENGYFSQPLKTLIYQTDEILVEEIISIIKEYKISEVVIGFPKNMNNTIGPKGEEAISFKNLLVDELTNIKDCKIILWDERLTTVTALKILSNKKNKQKAQKQQKDEVAASLILQNYLNSLERN